MPFKIIRNDITKMEVGAIVNAANTDLAPGGGVCGAIFEAAGRERLAAACAKIGRCETGGAVCTKGYDLPAKYIIHTPGPVYRDGKHGEEKLLYSCYKSSLELAKKKRVGSIAFPLISSGIYGYPKAEALRVATSAVMDFLSDNDMDVYIVIFDKAAYQIGEKLFRDITEYIDDNYADAHTDSRREQMRSLLLDGEMMMAAQSDAMLAPVAAAPRAAASSLDEAVSMIDESFSEMLLRKIDERGITDVQCYKKANIDRKLFSKIRSDRRYKPSKPTVLAFAIALELPLNETREMLMKAGFALSHSNKFDIIVEFFISRGNYNIFEINEALFAFDQSLLGA